MEHNNHNILVGHIHDIGLDPADSRLGQKRLDAVDPLVAQEGVVDDDQRRHLELGGNVQSTDRLAATRVKRDDAVVGFRVQEGVDHRQLGGANGARKGPVLGRCLGHFTLGYLAVAPETKVLGQVQVLGILVPHLVLGLKLGLDDGEGANGQFLLEHSFTMVFRDAISLKGQHDV